MKINQEIFFNGLDGLGFKKFHILGKDCWRGPDGYYYRMDHFGSVYTIEYAENDKDAYGGAWDDADLFDDDLPEDELVKQVQAALIRYINNEDGEYARELAEKEKAEAESKKE